MARYSLTDNEFKTIEKLISYSPKRGRKPTKIREMFDGILWILCSGAPWRDLPDHYPPHQSVYHRFRYYQKHGILEQVIGTLLKKASKNRKIQLTLVCIDGSYIRAHRHAAGAQKKNEEKDHALGRSRGGFTTKIHLICDQRGNPLCFTLTAGNVNDSAAFEECLNSFLVRMDDMQWRQRLALLVADKGYDAKRIRRFCRRYGLVSMIPKRRDKNGKTRRNRGFDKDVYKKRNVVERCLLWLKECRRVATRYEKLAQTYAAMVNMATIKRLLRKAVDA